MLCRLYLRKEHSSISDFSFRASSFVGETLCGDLVGLGYGEGRVQKRAGLGLRLVWGKGIKQGLTRD